MSKHLSRLNESQRQSLASWAEQHHVLYAQRPTSDLIEASRGFVCIELHLFGTHDPASHEPNTTCPECKLVWEHLHEIATAVIPPLQSGEHTNTRPFWMGIPYSHVHQRGPDVPLLMEIFVRLPEQSSLVSTPVWQAIKDALEKLGVRSAD